MLRQISYQTYFDKVLGGLVGKCVGEILGTPMKGLKKFHNINVSDKLFEQRPCPAQLDFEVLWLDLAQKKGPSIRETDLGDYWKKHVLIPWNEHGMASRNLELGIYPPQSGDFNNRYWQNSISSVTRSHFWGMLNPGMPLQAAFNAAMDALIDHANFSVEASMFLAALASEAFFEEDVSVLFDTLLGIFEADSEFIDLVTHVFDLSISSSFENGIGKIKSLYGDADCSSAPQNVALILFMLFYSDADFSNVVEAVNLGHESTAICSSLGAIYGIISGYSALGGQWKNLVSDQLALNPEIIDIRAPRTIREVAKETCRAGLSFIDFWDRTLITGKKPKPYELNPNRFNLNCVLDDYYPAYLDDFQKLIIDYDNLTFESSEVKCVFHSEWLLFKNEVINFIAAPRVRIKLENEFRLLPNASRELFSAQPEAQTSSFEYTVEVWIDGVLEKQLKRGVPFYGTWLVIGPFIQADESLVPMNSKYPEHELATLPSCQYLNHDKINVDTDFLTIDQIRQFASDMMFDNYPFEINIYNPPSGRMMLDIFYKGKGERTIYLYANLFSLQAKKVWLVMGCSGFIRLWFNGQLLYQRQDIRRSWPYDIAVEAELHSGINDILIKIDFPLDRVDFEIGFKEFSGQHPHQSRWDTSLVPFV